MPRPQRVRHDLGRRALVEGGRQQAEHRRDGHQAGGDAPEQRAQALDPRPEQEHGDRAEAGGEGGRRTRREQHEEVARHQPLSSATTRSTAAATAGLTGSPTPNRWPSMP